MAGSSRLPEVPLQWSEFMWSLERLRNKPYDKKMRERDWFRINPLEMVLLGCQSLTTNAPASRDHGTMLLVMEPIRDQMRTRPRFWKKVFSVLTHTLLGNNPAVVLQRCCSAVCGIWNCLKEIPEFQSMCYAWCIIDLRVAERLGHLVETGRISTSLELQQMLTEVESLCLNAKKLENLLNIASTDELHGKPTLITLLLPLLKEFLVVPTLGIQLHIMLSEAMECGDIPLHYSNLQKLLSAIKECSSDAKESVFNMLSIIQLVMVRSHGTTESESQIVEDEGGSTEMLVGDLFAALAAAMVKWKEMSSLQMQDMRSDVPCKLLSLAEVMLATKSLREGLREAADFFQWPVTVLMSYSNEGYLSDSPHEFLVELLEFVMSLVEQGEPPANVLQTCLPNLFGPTFGIKNHAVSCKLLEYGCLAVYSQHKKSLLTEGLRFLIDVFHLFPPIDEVRARVKADALHLEAMHVSQLILEDLLSSLPLQEEVGFEERVEVSGEENVLELPMLKDDSNGTGTLGSGDVFQPVSDMERKLDRKTRLQILLQLFQLACAMIRNGDNISFVYASILPKLFRESKVPVRFNKKKLSKFFGEDPPPPPGNITWKVDKKKLALQVLDLSILSVENGVASPFQLCGIVVPKLVKNVDRTGLSEEEKLELTIDILKITQETLEAGYSIEPLISHGIDLLSDLLPTSSSGDELRQFITQMARQLVSASYSSLLVLIKTSCQFMKANFPEEMEEIQDLFRALIVRGKRDEIRGVFRVCREQLKDEHYAPLRQFIYGYSTGALSNRQLLALCELLIAAMDVEKPQRSLREFQSNVEEEEEDIMQQKRELERAVITKLTAPCLSELKAALQVKRFKKDVWESISTQLSQIALFQTLFQSELASCGELSKDELLEIFKSKFPPEVLQSEDMMQLLALCATRIAHMQTPRFNSLKSAVTGYLRHFLTLEISKTNSIPALETGQRQDSVGGSGVADALEDRMRMLDCYLDAIPRNVEEKRRLVECGYSVSLWEKDISLVVRTDGSHSLEENMRQTLLACYTEFADILKQLAITHLSVDGELLKSSEVFSDELSLAELKGRRATAVRAIDQRLGRAKEGHFYERKVSLLAKEDEIEADFEKQARTPVKPKTFTVKLNTRFFDCARCCGSQIIGCYALTGEHCEKPLEIAMRCDGAIASVYDESGLEIENLEVLFTEEGAYLFKSYSNGHPYDTSPVWISLFIAMLKEPAVVPAIIIPNSYPNHRTWEALRRCVSTEMTGSILTCRHDFSPEWRTYYDHSVCFFHVSEDPFVIFTMARHLAMYLHCKHAAKTILQGRCFKVKVMPERIRLNMDMVLHPGFNLTTDQSRPLLLRQRSKLAKDLAGLIFEVVMQELLEDHWLKQFRFLGKVISQYISECVQSGERRPDIIFSGFDYDRWKKMLKKPLDIPNFLSDEPGLPPTKEKIVLHLLEFVDRGIISWCMNADLVQLCVNNHKQLLELKGFLEKTRYFHDETHLGKQLKAVHKLLNQCSVVVPLLSLPDSLQEEIIHWVFGNEDRVWRYRGGRDGHETLQQFMNFLGRGQENNDIVSTATSLQRYQKPYAGVVVFCLPCALEGGMNIDDTTTFRVDQMIAYALGEMVKPVDKGEDGSGELRMNINCYEIVTAWVHPRYRSLNLGVQMYLEIVQHAPARLVMCDMLQGSIERIITSNWLLRLLDRLRISRLVIQRRQQSYLVTTQTGHTEQFEQIVLNVRPLKMAVWVHHSAKWVRTNLHVVSIVALTTATVAVAVYNLPKLLK